MSRLHFERSYWAKGLRDRYGEIHLLGLFFTWEPAEYSFGIDLLLWSFRVIYKRSYREEVKIEQSV